MSESLPLCFNNHLEWVLWAYITYGTLNGFHGDGSWEVESWSFGRYHKIWYLVLRGLKWVESSLRVNLCCFSCVEEMLEHSSDSEMEPDSPEIIVTAYLKEPNLPMGESVPNPIDPEKPITRRNDPLLYWKNNEQSKPLLAKLACRFLCAPPGRIPSERLFSSAWDIADSKRNRLLPNKVEMLLFLDKNLLLLNFEY